MSYAGDVTSTEAYAALTRDPDAVLVDVRTAAEWEFVGLPTLRELGKDVVTVEWVSYGAGPNASFLAQLTAAGVGEGQPVYFLCRSGQRSRSAAEAATAAGLGPAYNVSDGFEGAVGPSGHRDVEGWKVAGLPWIQR